MTKCTRCLVGNVLLSEAYPRDGGGHIIGSKFPTSTTCTECGPLVLVVFEPELIDALADNHGGQNDPAYAVQSRIDSRSELVDGVGYALWIDLDEFHRAEETITR